MKAICIHLMKKKVFAEIPAFLKERKMSSVGHKLYVCCINIKPMVCFLEDSRTQNKIVFDIKVSVSPTEDKNELVGLRRLELIETLIQQSSSCNLK